MNSFKEKTEEILSLAGIKINGPDPWDIQVHDERLYGRVLSQGSLGLGESYMDGWWDCDRLDEFSNRLHKAHIDKKVKPMSMIFHFLKARLTNRQNKRRAKIVGEKHYDLGNDFYAFMLDKRMVYTCGYWKNANNLDEAQEHKLELVCRKIGLEPGMKILDIGCGWGSFAKYAAEKYKARVVGITVSKEQVELAKEICHGLPVEIRFQDYRDVDEKFDRIISLGMFEHVGYKNYRAYMEVAERNLKERGLFLLHTIGGNESLTIVDPWLEKYIFPNSLIPSIKQISAAMEGLFVMEDWHNFGPDYDKTLMAWFANYDRNWPQFKQQFDERFYRMWKYYLLICAGSFRSRSNQLWQIILSKGDRKEAYQSIR